MKTLDLYRIWEVLNFITEQEDRLNEKDIYPCFLGNMSRYYEQGFSYFLEHYSFRIDDDEICIFNDDQIPYEDYTNDDYSYISKELLTLDNKKLMSWIDKETEEYLINQEKSKNLEKENLKHQIKLLTQRLEKL